MAQATRQQTSSPTIKKRLFTTEEYLRMAEAGILHEDDRVELIEGEVVEMAAMGSGHAACVRKLEALLHNLAGQTFLVSTQCPIQLGDRTEPEPDLALLKPREDFYASKHPGPDDVLIAVEVSDTSLEYDRQVKLPLYARAGIPETWILDLTTNTIEAHSRPSNGEYRETLRARRGEEIESRVISGLTFAASDVLG
jgi:Uma2 family endonuclease